MKRKITKGFTRCIVFIIVLAIAMEGIPMAAFAKNDDKAKGVDTNYKMWYQTPAEENYSGWQSQSLPLGNGKVGASVFGGIKQERLQLTEETFWSGGPDHVDATTGKAMRGTAEYLGGNIPENGQDGAVLRQVQQYSLDGNNFAAANLANSKLIGVSDDGGTKGYGYFLSFGSLFYDYQSPAPQSDAGVSEYVRDLDISTAVASVSYKYDDTTYTREYFISHEDDVLVTQLTAEGKNKLNVNVKFDTNNEGRIGGEPQNNKGYTRTADKTVTVAGDQKTGTIQMTGKVKDNNLQYDSQARVIINGEGALAADDTNKLIKVQDATSIVTIMAIKSDYEQVYPGYRTGETAEELNTKVVKIVDEAAGLVSADKLYTTLKDRHIGDHQSLFNRLNLNIGQAEGVASTDAMMSQYKNGSLGDAQKRYLEVLMYQYGRYLTIAGSREDSQLPTNSQGIWTWGNSSPWHSDFHTNVSLQMNYWPTYASNLAECAAPLVDYVDALQSPGQVTSKIYTGIDNGMMFHNQNNPYGWTSPGWSFNWGWSTASMAWIIQNCWEYYEYTHDEEYLSSVIYPLMSKACAFYESYLVDDGTGKLVSTPSYSPEHGPTTNGNTYEQSLIWQLFDDTVTAGKVLGEDESTIIRLESVRDRLKGPIEIGESGQIKEWFEETTIDEEGYAIDANGNKMGEGGLHRNISHMLAAFPGDYISKDNPDLFEAAKVSMKMRTTEQTTGWAMAQRVNTWARLGDADEAYTWISRILKGSGGGGTFSNMWGYHSGPYFQIDGNFGFTAGVNEMLVQSNLGYIHLLPALPAEWSTGSVEGMRTRGNFEIDMAWENQHPTHVALKSDAGEDAILNYKNIAFADIKDEDGNPVDYKAVGVDKVQFATEVGKTYVVTDIPVGEVSVVPATPEGVKTERISDEAINVSWMPVREVVNEENNIVVALGDEADATITYNVYRKFDGSSSQLIASNLKEESLIKNDDGTLSYHDMGEVAPYMGVASYQISAVKAGVESRLSAVAKVVEKDISIPVESVTLSTQSGATTVAKKDSKITMIAKVAPATVENNAVTWSVVNNGTDASISSDGVLSTGKNQGIITVKAVSNADGLTEGTIDIKVAYPTKYIETKEDDGSIASGGGDIGVANPKFQFDPSDTTWLVWAGERDRHYGGTKSESNNVNSSLSYEFEGDGIAVYGQKHGNFGAMKVDIDGTQKGIFSMNDGNMSGMPQQMIAEFYDLGEGKHTISISPAVLDGTTKTQANLDYFVVYQINPDNIVDKAPLQNSMEAADAEWTLGEDCFETATWNEFAKAWADGVKVMNASDATDKQVTDAATALDAAADALVSKTPSALDMLKVDFKAQGIETKSVVLHWNKVDGAQEYDVYRGENLVGSTKQNYLRVSNLSASTEYGFKLVAKATTGATGSAQIDVKTQIEASARPKSAEITKVMRVNNGYQISWAGENSQMYLVFVNGKAIMENPTSDKTYTLTNMTKDMQYAVGIIAVSGTEQATPTTAMLKYSATEVVTVPSIKDITVKEGTSFDTIIASLPSKLEVVLSDGHSAELPIEWKQGDYDENTAKTYTLEGSLTLGTLMSNTQILKAVVNVTVQGSTSPKPPITVNKAELQSLYDSNKNKTQCNYTDESFAKFKQALEGAKAVLDRVDATQAQVNDAQVALSTAIDDLTEKSTNIIEDIKNAPAGGTVTVPIDTNGKISANVFEAAQGKDVNLVADYGGYSWTVNGKTITGVINPNGYNLSIKVINKAELTILASNKDFMQIEITHEGVLPFKAVLKISVGTTYDGKQVHLYYYNEVNRTLEFQSSSQVIDGFATFEFTHFSKYVLTSDKASTDSPKAEDKTSTNPVKTGDTADFGAWLFLTIVSGGVVIWKLYGNKSKKSRN